MRRTLLCLFTLTLWSAAALAANFQPVNIGKNVVAPNDRADIVRKLSGPPTEMRDFPGSGRVEPGVEWVYDLGDRVVHIVFVRGFAVSAWEQPKPRQGSAK